MTDIARLSSEVIKMRIIQKLHIGAWVMALAKFCCGCQNGLPSVQLVSCLGSHNQPPLIYVLFGVRFFCLPQSCRPAYGCCVGYNAFYHSRVLGFFTFPYLTLSLGRSIGYSGYLTGHISPLLKIFSVCDCILLLAFKGWLPEYVVLFCR